MNPSTCDEHYIWRTKCDDNVHSTHLALEGKVFSEKEPPAFGFFPGQDYNCRCIKEPIPLHVFVIPNSQDSKYCIHNKLGMDAYREVFSNLILEIEGMLKL